MINTELLVPNRIRLLESGEITRRQVILIGIYNSDIKDSTGENQSLALRFKRINGKSFNGKTVASANEIPGFFHNLAGFAGEDILKLRIGDPDETIIKVDTKTEEKNLAHL